MRDGIQDGRYNRQEKLTEAGRPICGYWSAHACSSKVLSHNKHHINDLDSEQFAAGKIILD